MATQDVTIAGAGPVGAFLSVLLAEQGRRVTVIDRQPAATWAHDPRTLALSFGSRLLLERAGIWSAAMAQNPIEHILVSQKGGPGSTRLLAAELDVPALGYVMTFGDLMGPLHTRMQAAGVHIVGASVTATQATPAFGVVRFEADGSEDLALSRLVVVADGGHTPDARFATYRREYGQEAVVAHVRTERAEAGMAVERFTPDGPVALLPLGDHWALIWTASPARAQALVAMEPDAFLAALHEHFGDALGRFTAVSRRGRYPLTLQYTRTPVGRRTVRVGNAAQILHPVAGQGLNLGLRDAWWLARTSRERHGEALGRPDHLRCYLSRRQRDRIGGVLLTDAMMRVFANAQPVLQQGRGLALDLMGQLPWARRWFARQMMFGVGQ